MLSASPHARGTPKVNPVMAPMYVSAMGQTASPAGSSTPPSAATTPTQMRRFYAADNINFNGVPGDGRGTTIAIVDAYHYSTALGDLTAFDAFYGLPNPTTFTILNQLGQSGNLPIVDNTGVWGVEAALDVQWAHVMAPLANITLVEAASSSTDDLFQAVKTAANLPGVVCVSMSFGTPEAPGEAAMWDSNFLTPSGHAGVTFIAATGDSGTPGTYPAFSPNVVAVGGTAITHGADGTYISETTWNHTGGGTSLYEPRPSYQNGVQGSSKRTIPDLSLDSQPSTGVAIYDSQDLGASTPWGQYGGTSLATPMFAGLVAVADQGRLYSGLAMLDGASQVLPTLYSLSSGDFHDITTGASDGGASAVSGYDLATGIGSPVANKLVNHLAGVASILPQVTGTSGNDNFSLMLDMDRLYVDWSNGVTSGQVAFNDPNGLTINGGGGNDTLTLNIGWGNALPSLLKLNGNFTIEGMTGPDALNGKTIDINRSTVFFDYSDFTDIVPALRQAVLAGYNGGTWNGQATASAGAIISSAAAAGAGTYAVGYADAADGVIPGEPANMFEAKFTLAGDTNLDGAVNSTDAITMARNYLIAGKSSWDLGNFNFDSTINFSDAQILQKNFGSALAQGAVAAASVTGTDSTTSITTTSATPGSSNTWSGTSALPPTTVPTSTTNDGLSHDDGFSRGRKKGKAFR